MNQELEAGALVNLCAFEPALPTCQESIEAFAGKNFVDAIPWAESEGNCLADCVYPCCRTNPLCHCPKKLASSASSAEESLSYKASAVDVQHEFHGVPAQSHCKNLHGCSAHCMLKVLLAGSQSTTDGQTDANIF
eukprot:2757882-Amphidinium_carterae.2